MILSEIKYPIEENKNKITIFDRFFVEKNKHFYRILYKNKLYPLQELFEITDNKSKELKIKLISYNNFLNINKIIKEFDTYKNKFHEMSKMVYKIDDNEEKKIDVSEEEREEDEDEEKGINIFGANFVKENKDKCIVMYINKVFHLKETILKEDIEDVDKTNK